MGRHPRALLELARRPRVVVRRRTRGAGFEGLHVFGVGRDPTRSGPGRLRPDGRAAGPRHRRRWRGGGAYEAGEWRRLQALRAAGLTSSDTCWPTTRDSHNDRRLRATRGIPRRHRIGGPRRLRVAFRGRATAANPARDQRDRGRRTRPAPRSPSAPAPSEVRSPSPLCTCRRDRRRNHQGRPAGAGQLSANPDFSALQAGARRPACRTSRSPPAGLQQLLIARRRRLRLLGCVEVPLDDRERERHQRGQSQCTPAMTCRSSFGSAMKAYLGRRGDSVFSASTRKKRHVARRPGADAPLRHPA